MVAIWGAYKRHPMKSLAMLTIGLLACSSPSVGPSRGTVASSGIVQGEQDPRVILFVWDGLRPDSVNATDTPNLERLRQRGVDFRDQHATFPSFTMMNAASFATGSYSGTAGFYGNTLWQPKATGNNAAGSPVDFLAPVYSEDYAILNALNAAYDHEILASDSLFDLLRAAGYRTAAIGKSGAAFLQQIDVTGASSSVVLDEKAAFPLDFALALQAKGVPLPKLTPGVTLAPTNGDPTAVAPTLKLTDGVTTDPSQTQPNPWAAANEYLMRVFTEYVMPEHDPHVTVIWLRSPDSAQHAYGPGTAMAKLALHDQDRLLGLLLDALEERGTAQTTDVIVVSDHAHSTVSGRAPLRAIENGAVGAENVQGFSVSGEVRLAEVLTDAGFAAFDGAGCVWSPVLSGRPTKHDSEGCTGSYTTKSYKLPDPLPADAVVIAANGGSEYLYIPSQSAELIERVVRALQGREEIGAIFVRSGVYGVIPGTLPLEWIGAEHPDRSPDIIVGYTFDEDAIVAGMPGTTYASMFNNRGMHGGFSPRDVHNSLFAYGPHFALELRDELPSANVDVAPTIAALFGITMPDADGRVLYEAFAGGMSQDDYELRTATFVPGELAELDDGTYYRAELEVKSVELFGEKHWYFDTARAYRY